MRILELGSYVAPAYAGMILAEQGDEVTKWSTGDPIHGLHRGDELWEWINHGKAVLNLSARLLLGAMPWQADVVIDNFRRDTWARWAGVDEGDVDELLDGLARDHDATWVSLRGDDNGRSFDVTAQEKAWGDICEPVPFYLGDTAAGLWLAFKALAAPIGHHTIYQATVLAKLVEGELVVPRDRARYPFEGAARYGVGPAGAVVDYRGEELREPPRDAAWRRHNLHHRHGRYTV